MMFLFFLNFILAESFLSTEKMKSFPTTKSIMIFNSAEHKPRKSGKIKFKVQELKSLVDCSALRCVHND